MPRFAQAAAHQFSGGWWPASTSKQHATRDIIRLDCEYHNDIWILCELDVRGEQWLRTRPFFSTSSKATCLLKYQSTGHFDFNTNRSLAVWRRVHPCPILPSFAVKLLQLKLTPRSLSSLLAEDSHAGLLADLALHSPRASHCSIPCEEWWGHSSYYSIQQHGFTFILRS